MSNLINSGIVDPSKHLYPEKYFKEHQVKSEGDQVVASSIGIAGRISNRLGFCKNHPVIVELYAKKGKELVEAVDDLLTKNSEREWTLNEAQKARLAELRQQISFLVYNASTFEKTAGCDEEFHLELLDRKLKELKKVQFEESEAGILAEKGKELANVVDDLLIRHRYLKENSGDGALWKLCAHMRPLFAGVERDIALLVDSASVFGEATGRTKGSFLELLNRKYNELAKAFIADTEGEELVKAGFELHNKANLLCRKDCEGVSRFPAHNFKEREAKREAKIKSQFDRLNKEIALYATNAKMFYEATESSEGVALDLLNIHLRFAKKRYPELETGVVPCDLTIIAKEGRVQVNSEILKTNSSIFQTIFQKGMREQTESAVKLDISGITVYFLMKYLYARPELEIELPPCHAIVMELLETVRTYRFDNLMKKLEPAVTRFFCQRQDLVVKNGNEWLFFLSSLKEAGYVSAASKWLADITPYFLGNFDIPVIPSEQPGNFVISISDLNVIYNAGAQDLLKQLPVVVNIKDEQEQVQFETVSQTFKIEEPLRIKLMQRP